MVRKAKSKAFALETSKTDAMGRKLTETAPSDSLNTIKKAPKAGAAGGSTTEWEVKDAKKREAPKESELKIKTRKSDTRRSKMPPGKPDKPDPKFSFQQVKGDLFDAPNDFSLAHCVAEDFHMGAGIAVEFRKKFKGTGALLDQNKTTGQTAVLEDKGRFIYYLVTKKFSRGKPTVESLTNSLCDMKEHMVANNVLKLAMPAIGCGLDRLDWMDVEKAIRTTFCDTDVEIVVYNYDKAQDESVAKQTNYGRVTLTTDNLLKISSEGTAYGYLSCVDPSLITKEMKDLDKKYAFISEYKNASHEMSECFNVKNTFGLVCVDKNGYLSYKSLEKSAMKFKIKTGKSNFGYLALQVDFDDELTLKKIEHVLKFTVGDMFEIWICHSISSLSY